MKAVRLSACGAGSRLRVSGGVDPQGPARRSVFQPMETAPPQRLPRWSDSLVSFLSA